MFFYEKFVKILFVLVGEVMRYLGLDLGTRTLGVAISDTSHIIASPLTVIRFPEGQYEIALEELKKILDEYQISKIALGLPKNMNGSEGFASERSRLFKELLEQNIDIPVYLVDERLSTMEAEILLEVDLSRKKRKKVIDGVAAVIILETFIKMEENK